MKGYIIENDFQLAFESNEEKPIKIDDESLRKCIPIKNANQMPYQKIEKELRQNREWPPITPQTTDANLLNGNVIRQTVAHSFRHSKKRTISTASTDSKRSVDRLAAVANNDTKSKMRSDAQIAEEYTRV